MRNFFKENMTLDSNKVERKVLTTIQQEYKILAEYKMIESEKIGGIYVIPSFANSLLWYGVIFVRQGFYEDGVFRFNILLPDKFPDDTTVPSVVFQSDIYHPLICPLTGALDLSYAFSQWRCGEDHIWQLLKYILAIFNDVMDCINVIEGTKWLNKEAAELIVENCNEFSVHARHNVEISKRHLYDEPPTDDPHYITFEYYNADIHEAFKQRIKEGKEPISSTPVTELKGLSWVKEGEFIPLTLE